MRMLAFLLGLSAASLTAASASSTVPGIYGFEATTIDGKTVPLSSYQGKVALVVNTASRCGFTPQYEGLQKLFRKYEARGLVILGFPSNDFAGQEPGTNGEIKKFCTLKYDVGFPMFSKDKVTGPAKQPLYHYLTERSPDKFRGEVQWNFEKFLIDRKGNVIGRFRSKVKPDDPELIQAIEAAL